MERNAKYWIEQLKLVKQINGSYLKESYRSDEVLKKDQLPFRYRHQRNFSSSHYLLIEEKTNLKFIRKKSDEIWHFYDGSPLTFHFIDEDGNYSEKTMGKNPDNKEYFQIFIRRGSWFAVTLIEPETFSLTGITSTPASSPEDIEKGFKVELIRQFPHLKNEIEEYGE